MQCKTIDLISAQKLLQTAAEDIVQLRSFDAVLNKASTIASTWGLPRLTICPDLAGTVPFFQALSRSIDRKSRFFIQSASIARTTVFLRFPR